jgi:putative selenate reductase
MRNEELRIKNLLFSLISNSSFFIPNSMFRPIPFADLIRRVFAEYHQYGKIFGLPKEKFFMGLPDVNLAVNYMGRRASTPLGPAAGPHTQLAQNIVLAWLTGSRIFELKTVQILDHLQIPRPCIDTETIGFNVEWSQELPLEVSLREYVKAWMLIEMIKASQLLGEEFSRHDGDTVFDLSVGYDLQGVQSEAITVYIQGLKDASATMTSLRAEIPPEFARFKELQYNSRIIDSVTLSTFHGCPADQIDQIVTHLLTEHQVNVIVKINPTLLGQAEVTQILQERLGYTPYVLHTDAFEHDLRFDQAIDLTRSLFRTASSCGKTLGLKFTNTLVLKNHRGYFADAVMYMSGRPLHVLALRLLQKFREALGALHTRIPTSFSAGVDEQNVADVLSLNLIPVTVCTDLLKPPGYEKGTTYLKHLEEQMQTVGAINLSDYIMKRFDREAAAVDDVFNALRNEVKQSTQTLPEAVRESTLQEYLHLCDPLQARVLNALRENNNSLKLLTTDALITTETLKACRQKFGEHLALPQTFRELYERIIAAAAEHNLATLLDQTTTNPRYRYEYNRKIPKKLPSNLQLYDCTSCGRCVAVCPNNANFVYHVKPVEMPYRNYQLTAEGVKEIAGGVFVLEKFYQIANFADCCNECSVCAIHCVETGKPYRAKPKYFGNLETWAAQGDDDGFYVEIREGIESIVGRIDGKEYALQYDPAANRSIFGDGVLEGVFEYPTSTLVHMTVLDSQKLGHILDMRAYYILLTQLKGVLDPENCNYVNVKYSEQ